MWLCHQLLLKIISKLINDNIISTTTLEQNDYWKINAFYPVSDTIINWKEKKRFSDECFKIATCVNNLLKLNFEMFSLGTYKSV